MVSLRELSRPDFTLHWHEAVALVAETAAVLQDDGLTSVPDPESVILTPDGTLHLLDKGRQSLAPARRLGEMLDVLLSSTACPPELRQLVAQSLADPPAYATIDDFARALAFFERPGREELLMAVAARASEVALEVRAHTELERLEARTRSHPPQPELAHSPERSRSRTRRVVFVFAGSLIVSTVVGGILGLRATESEARARGASTLTQRVRARIDGIAIKGLEAVGLRTPAKPTVPPPAVSARPAAVRKSSRKAPRPAPVTISMKELASGPVSPLAAAVSPESPTPIVRDEAVYTAAEESVEPAVLMRPQMPSRPPAEATSEEVGVLEIVVSEMGAVEQVRLLSTANRYQDRMIVAAAKAWRFEPAMKNGQPVRYRIRIRVTL